MPQDYASFPEGMMDAWRALIADGVLETVDNSHFAKGFDDGVFLIPELFDHPAVMPLQRKRELRAMGSMAATLEPRVAMEVGADKGGTLAHWLACQPTLEKMVACEYRGTPYKHFFEKAFPQVEFLWLEDSSYSKESWEKVKDFLGAYRFDFIFLDGDKNAFRKDFALYSPMVRRGGMVFVHDVYDRAGNSRCSADFREFSRGLTVSLIIDLAESVAAKLNASRGTPSSGCHEDWLRASGDDCGVGVIHID